MKNQRINRTSITFFRAIAMVGLLLFSTTTFTYGQEARKDESARTIVEVKLIEGSIIAGELLSEGDDHIIISNASLGEITIQRSKMESFKVLPAGSFVDGVYWHTTANSSRNIFSPTGYSLKKGEGYYQNFMLLINQISYGVTDNFSIGVGFEIASLLIRANSFNEENESNVNLPAFMITPKLSFPIKEDKWNVGVGALILSIPYNKDLVDLGVVYGVSTWGGRDNNFTLGVGMSATEDGIGSAPAITLSGTRRFSKRMALTTENWIISEGGETAMLNSLGFRYLGNRVSVDLALIGGSFDGEFGVSPIPLVGFTIPFGTGWGK